MMITDFECAILSRLAQGEKTGWELQPLGYFHGFGNLSAFAIIPALRMMERDGLITSRWLRDQNGRRGRLFAITRRGEKAYRRATTGGLF